MISARASESERREIHAAAALCGYVFAGDADDGARHTDPWMVDFDGDRGLITEDGRMLTESGERLERGPDGKFIGPVGRVSDADGADR